MRGLLADVNLQGHALHIRRAVEALGLWPILEHERLEFATFDDLRIPLDIDDRSLWALCQSAGWVLLTDNRNRDGADSLETTLLDSWQPGNLPILTLANKRKFEQSVDYALRVSSDVAELLFGIANGQYRDRRRIYVPL